MDTPCARDSGSVITIIVHTFGFSLISVSEHLTPFSHVFYSQIMIIMAWHGLESPLQLLDPTIFEDILSIFITNAALRVIQGLF